MVFFFIMNIRFCYTEEYTLRVGYQDNEGSPLVMGSGAKIGNPPGIGVDIMLQVAKDLNIKLITSRLPNKRIHKYLRLGIFDGYGFYSSVAIYS